MPRPRIVLVEWWDSFGCPAGWQFAEDVAPDVVLVQSVGWLLKETDQFKFLAPHVNEKRGASDRPQIAGYITIPQGAVKRQVVLETTSSYRRTRRAAPAASRL